MNSPQNFIKEKLDERRLNGTYRSLKAENNLIDFCSNDYLGFARSTLLRNWINEEVEANQGALNGATGSRLLSGNLAYTENLEREIAFHHKSEAGLIYNSGYDANIGLFSSLPQKGDTLISDELVHASIIDGMRLSYANRFRFKHNDLLSLEDKLKHAAGVCYVVIESVYSMDGDIPPVSQILELTEKYNAHLIVDEAHAVGVFGLGIINQLGLEDRIFARVITFGKALGCHGAVILGSDLLRQYLINFSRSFIYTTAASFHQLASVKMAYRLLSKSHADVKKLHQNITLLKASIKSSAGCDLIPGDSAIQCLVVGSNEKATHMAHHLQSAGFDVRPILSPTVPKEKERIRICLHSFNTPNEVTSLAETITKLINARQ